ncbi:MAG: hypothetical protein R2703_03685 [Micropruina glycogenica]
MSGVVVSHTAIGTRPPPGCASAAVGAMVVSAMAVAMPMPARSFMVVHFPRFIPRWI